MGDEQYRTLNENNSDDKYLEAYIVWAKTSIELNNILVMLYQQSKHVDDPQLLKQIIETAYKSKEKVLDNETAYKVTKYFNDKVKIEE